MAAESYWQYHYAAVDPRQQAPVPALMWQQQQAGYQPVVAPVALPVAAPPLPAGPPPPFKRQRPEYFDMPSGQGNGLFHEAMSPHYGHRLNNQMSYAAGANQSDIPLGGMARYSAGMDSGNHGATRTESKTLYVEGLPSNCTKREVAHIFRPFSGFREVRLVNKESRHAGSYNLLCFVDFSSPPEARAALETLQGYKFDEHDHESSNLHIQFSLAPRKGPIGGPRVRN
uniref:RRM domain-containing protein n=1 Tax=Oryza punctata TaxID=4537 RepID=A0A0E0M3N7_ORYPU